MSQRTKVAYRRELLRVATVAPQSPNAGDSWSLEKISVDGLVRRTSRRYYA